MPPELDAELEKAAQESRMSKAEWVRRALRQAVGAQDRQRTMEALDRLGGLHLPACDMEQMNAEIEAGRFEGLI